jgi:hypothetical protein
LERKICLSTVLEAGKDSYRIGSFSDTGVRLLNTRKNMLLIDEPYVSDFLIDTIRDYHFKIISTPIARELINDDALEWLTENDAIKLKKSNSLHPLYSISENGLDWIEQNLKGSELARQISVLKDKFKFRELIKNTFPNFYFKQVSLEDTS